MKFDPQAIALLLYMAGSLCFLGGSVVLFVSR